MAVLFILHLAIPVTCTALREYLPPAISHKILPQKKICIKINMLTYRAFAAGSRYSQELAGLWHTVWSERRDPDGRFLAGVLNE